MTLILTAYDHTYSITAPEDGTTTDVVRLCSQLLMAAGHAPVNVAAGMVACGEEYFSANPENSLDMPAEPV